MISYIVEYYRLKFGLLVCLFVCLGSLVYMFYRY